MLCYEYSKQSHFEKNYNKARHHEVNLCFESLEFRTLYECMEENLPEFEVFPANATAFATQMYPNLMAENSFRQ